MEHVGFELATPPSSVVLGKLSATLAQYSAKRKAEVPERISSPEIRLAFLRFSSSSGCIGTPEDLRAISV